MKETIKLPAVGLGTFQITGEETAEIVSNAIANGYRLIDTAAVYGNEKEIAQALKTCGLKREEYFVTSKVANSVLTYDETIAAYEKSCMDLELEYLDLYLIHWPKGKERDREVWRALEELYTSGRVKAIGVSNFEIPHLDDLLETAKIAPMMNQIEISPLCQQFDVHEYCWNFDIALTAYGSLMQGNNLDNPVLMKIANKHNRSVPQIILRWLLQRGIFVIPKSTKPTRMVQNINIRDFELTQIEMEKIADMNQDYHYYPHPEKRG